MKYLATGLTVLVHNVDNRWPISVNMNLQICVLQTLKHIQCLFSNIENNKVKKRK